MGCSLVRVKMRVATKPAHFHTLGWCCGFSCSWDGMVRGSPGLWTNKNQAWFLMTWQLWITTNLKLQPTRLAFTAHPQVDRLLKYNYKLTPPIDLTNVLWPLFSKNNNCTSDIKINKMVQLQKCVPSWCMSVMSFAYICMLTTFRDIFLVVQLGE